MVASIALALPSPARRRGWVRVEERPLSDELGDPSWSSPYARTTSRRRGKCWRRRARRSGGGCPALLTLVGIELIAAGAELVTFGAQRMISLFAVPAALIRMIVTPAAIELEAVIRQAIPAREGRPDVSAGNLVG